MGAVEIKKNKKTNAKCIRGALHINHWDVVTDQTWERQNRSWVQSSKPGLLLFIPWDAAMMGLDIQAIYWETCLWRKVGWEWEKPGRFLRPQCGSDSCEGEREGSFGVQCSSKRGSTGVMEGGGVFEVTSPIRGKAFLTELGLLHIPAGSLR